MKIRRLINKYIVAFLFLLVGQFLTAQSVEKSFINMPDNLMPVLSEQNRLEMVEYFKAGQNDSVVNKFGNKSIVLVFDSTQQVLKVKTTAISTFEMQLFSEEVGKPVIGVISTVCAPICLSIIQFYDTAWNQVPISFDSPTAINWLQKEKLETSSVDQEWVYSELENNFISLTFGIGEISIVAQNNSIEFFNENDKKLISRFLDEKPIVYKLVGKSWVKKMD